MKVLITADTHLTQKSDDAYRFEFLFSWLPKTALKNEVDEIWILGDLVDKKDGHSGKFLNQVLDYFDNFIYRVPIRILQGNHDYRQEHFPSFRFLENACENVQYIIEPFYHEKTKSLWIPPPFSEDKQEVKKYASQHVNPSYLLLHTTVSRARTSTGFELEGISVKQWQNMTGAQKIFSGDIHVPQDIGVLTYIGSPYHVKFGDNFEPRVVVLDTETGETEDIQYEEAPKKITIEAFLADLEEAVQEQNLCKGDMVKVRLHTMESAPDPDWVAMEKVQEVLQPYGVLLRGLELIPDHARDTEAEDTMPLENRKEVFQKFCESEMLYEEAIEIGRQILEEVEQDEA